jgi:hypothetical protein
MNDPIDNIEQNKLASLNSDNNANNEVVGETVELLGAVGELSRDAYIGAVRQARSFVTFLHKQIKP